VFGSFESHYFTFHFLGDVVVAKCVMPNLSEEENIEPVGQELLTLVGKYECRRLILDLANVEYMTSSMVGKLIRIHRQMHRDDGRVVLCHLSPTVDEILRTSHLLSYFHVAESLDEAAAQFAGLADEDASDADEGSSSEDHDTVDDF
jgi:anti-anti-sigma factor